MQVTAGKARMNSFVTFFYGLLHIDVPVLADQQERIYISSVRTQSNLEDLPGAMDDWDGSRE